MRKYYTLRVHFGTQLTLKLLYKSIRAELQKVKIRQFIEYIPNKTPFLHPNKISRRGWFPREKKPRRSFQERTTHRYKASCSSNRGNIRIYRATLLKQFCYAETRDEKAPE